MTTTPPKTDSEMEKSLNRKLREAAKEQARFILNNMERKFAYHSAFFDWDSLTDHLFNQLQSIHAKAVEQTEQRVWDEAATLAEEVVERHGRQMATPERALRARAQQASHKEQAK